MNAVALREEMAVVVLSRLFWLCQSQGVVC